MKRIMKRICLSLLAVLFGFGITDTQVCASGTVNVTMDVKYGQTEARSMLDMINAFRTGEDAWAWNELDSEKIQYSGLGEFVYDYELEKVAMQRAAEIAVAFSHTRPNGESCFLAYPKNVYKNIGENIAAGSVTAKEVFENWKEENKNYIGQGHRRNMLSQDFGAVGIGHVYYNGIHYWVQEFGDAAKDTVQTPADDKNTDVPVDILETNITDKELKLNVTELNVMCGESVALPEYSVDLSVKETWPDGAKITALSTPEWKIDHAEYAEIEGNSVKGITQGTANMTVSALGLQSIIPIAVEHNIIVDGAIEATCTEDGKTEGKHCSGCNTVITAQTIIPAKGHTEVIDEAKKATCTEDGKTEGKHCSVCKEILVKQETIPANGHTEVIDEAKKVTCTEDGKTEGKHCAVCGDVLIKQEIIPAKGHEYEVTEAAIEPTCTESGKTEGKRCRVCGDVLAAKEVSAKGHVKVTEIRPATLHLNGEKKVTCSACSDILSTEIIHKIASIAWTNTNYTYNGKVQMPKVTIKDNAGKLLGKTDYTISYTSNCKNVGQHSVKVVLKGNYSGSSNVTYTITPKGTKISKLSKGKKKITVKWKKQTSQTTGYQIQYSTKKNFKSGTKTATISKNKTTSKTLSKLKAKKKYYVRIRTYKTTKVNGKSVKIYSAWSTAKSVKIK